MRRVPPTIDLPRLPAAGTAQPDGLRDAVVLVIDDQPVNVEVLERLLRAAGLTAVHGLTDPREALSRTRELQPDLVLLDLHMPHLDGYAVLAELRAALPADDFMPVLVLTADVSGDARERALHAGAKDFLTKPFDRVETLQRVCNLLETRALFLTVRNHNAELQAELDERAAEERRIAEDLRLRRSGIEGVLRDRSMTMVFHPVVELATGRTVGVEALARFDCEPHRPPNEWFSEAATVDLGVALELAAIDAALAELPGLGPERFMAVNTSPLTAMSAAFASRLAGPTASRVVVELTEHTRVEDYGALVAALDPLRAAGARIAVDDAGAGYAGLQHLLELRPDVIKLDLELTRGVDIDPARRALGRSLVEFGNEIGAHVVAEGIETAEELQALRALNVAWGQGYHLARPGPLPPPRTG